MYGKEFVRSGAWPRAQFKAARQPCYTKDAGLQDCGSERARYKCHVLLTTQCACSPRSGDPDPDLSCMRKELSEQRSLWSVVRFRESKTVLSTCRKQLIPASQPEVESADLTAVLRCAHGVQRTNTEKGGFGSLRLCLAGLHSSSKEL